MVNERTIRDWLKPVVELFQCNVCTNILTKPSQLQCGHIFCSECIKTIVRTEKSEAKCPNCRRKLCRRGVRLREDIIQLNLAVGYLEEVLLKVVLLHSENSNKNEESSADTSFNEEMEASGCKETQYWSGLAAIVKANEVAVGGGGSSDSSRNSSPMEQNVCNEVGFEPTLLSAGNSDHSPGSAINVDPPLRPTSKTTGLELDIYTDVDDNFSGQPPPQLSQSQALDLRMPSSTFMNADLEDEHSNSKTAIAFVKALDLSTRAKRSRESTENHEIAVLFQQPQNIRRHNPGFLFQDDRYNINKRQRMEHDGFECTPTIIGKSNPRQVFSVNSVTPIIQRHIGHSTRKELGQIRKPEQDVPSLPNEPEEIRKSEQSISAPSKEPEQDLHFRQDVHSPIKEPEQDVHSPLKESKQPLHSPLKESEQDLHSPIKEPEQDLHSPIKESEQDLRSPLKESEQNLHSPLKEPIEPGQIRKSEQDAHSKVVVANLDLDPFSAKQSEPSVAEDDSDSDTSIFEATPCKPKTIPIRRSLTASVIRTPKILFPESTDTESLNLKSRDMEETKIENSKDKIIELEQYKARDDVWDDDEDDQVIPVTPDKPGPSSDYRNSNNGGRNEEEFNSRSTFASPLPSQFNLSMALESPKSQSQSQRKKFLFCPSRLNRIELAKLQDMCSVCDGTITKDYTDDVTHLVIKLEKGRVPQTMKYLFAIADKKWVVVFDWILECAMQGAMVAEEPYESSGFPECDSGVRRSRLDPTLLFSEIYFYFPTTLKSSGSGIEDCKKLVEKMGGTIVRNPFAVDSGTGLMIVGEGIQSRHLYQEFYKTKGWLSVSWTWILDCLLSYNIVPFTKSHLLTMLDGTSSVNLPDPLIPANNSTTVSSQFSHPSGACY